jgi:hypothetical protein
MGERSVRRVYGGRSQFDECKQKRTAWVREGRLAARTRGIPCNSSLVMIEVLPTECGGLPQFDSPLWEG